MYARITKSYADYGKLISFEDAQNNEFLNKLIKEDINSDWYQSLYYYPEEAKELFEKNGSIAGYNGPALSNGLMFDFDSADLLEAKKDTSALLNKLAAEGIDVHASVRIYFSGNKGFHVFVPTSKLLDVETMKNVCINLGKDLPTFDQVIYNTTRIFRMPYTKHQTTKLFKVELDPAEFKAITLEQIKGRARLGKRIERNVIPVTDLSFVERNNIHNEKNHSIQSVIVSEDISGIRGLDSIDFSKCPKTTPRCIYALSKGVMTPGERSRVFHRLANYYRNQGMDKEVTYNTLKGIARLNHRLYPDASLIDKDEMWTEHISSAYSMTSIEHQKAGGAGTGAENELIAKYCRAIISDVPCCLHHKRELPVVKIDDVSTSFSSFASNLDRNTVKTGIDLIDKYMKLAVGTTTLLVGACGSGKTTVALNIMENANANNLHTMFFSLDMHKNLVYLKLAQKLTGYSQDEILNFYKTNNKDRVTEIRKAISDKYGKTFFDFSTALTLDEMQMRVMATEEKNNCKIKLVVVDYASRIISDKTDIYANAKHNALKSTEVAGNTDAAWIFLAQISRNTGDGCAPLRTKRAAKESGDWEETATNVITMWRPFMGKEGEDDIVRMFLAKNRMGPEIERPLYWNGEKGYVLDMNASQLQEYEETRQQEEKEYLKDKFIR